MTAHILSCVYLDIIGTLVHKNVHLVRIICILRSFEASLLPHTSHLIDPSTISHYSHESPICVHSNGLDRPI
jgi:hypothetical protein